MKYFTITHADDPVIYTKKNKVEIYEAEHLGDFFHKALQSDNYSLLIKLYDQFQYKSWNCKSKDDLDKYIKYDPETMRIYFDKALVNLSKHQFIKRVDLVSALESGEEVKVSELDNGEEYIKYDDEKEKSYIHLKHYIENTNIFGLFALKNGSDLLESYHVYEVEIKSSY